MTAVDARGRLVPGLIVAIAALWVSVPLVSGDGATLPRALAHALSPSAAPAAARMPVGLREAASAAAGAGQSGFHVRQHGAALVATGGGLASRFDAGGVHVGAGGAAVTFALAAADTVPTSLRNRVTYRRGDVTEWYVNGPAGLEQGFTLARHHPLSLQLSGMLVPRQVGQAIEFTSGTRGPVVLRYSGLTAFDARGRSLPARLELAGRTLSLRVDDRGARYPVTVDPMIQQGPALVPSDGGSFGDFGWSVSLSSDGNTALVGAPNDSNNLGGAWVFTRSNGAWTQQGPVLRPDPQTVVGGNNGTGFGYSVSLSADGDTAMIGGYYENSLHGAVWVTTRSNGTWSTPTKIPFPSDENGTARFGSAVALAPDGKTAVIGGNGDGGGSVAAPVPGAGAAWIYTNPGTGWAEDTKVTGFGIEVGAGAFGSSVAIATPSAPAPAVIAIGAPGDNAGQSSAPGKVWIFDDSDGWLFQGTLFPSDMTTPAAFGTSVALSADGTVALVGGPTDDPADDGSQTGSAWVFNFTALAGWQQTAHLVPSDVGGQFPPFFGTGVALSADANTALVGGDQDDSFTGAAWVFKHAATWTQECKEVPGEAIASAVGHSVALSADGGTELVGGPFSATTNDEGAAWVFVEGACVSNTRSTVIDDQSARIQGTVNPNGFDVTYKIEYGTTTAYGQSTTAAALGANASPVDVDQTLTGLLPATLYHYRISATGAGGVAGQDRTFTTGNQLTGTSGAAVSGVLASGAGCPGQTATVNWGDATQPSQTTVDCTVFNDALFFSISGTHTYAAPGHFTIAITTDDQSSFGAGALIAAPPTITGTASQNVGTTTADVSATINPNGAATTYVVKYGTSTNYDQQTSAVAIGSAFTGQSASQTLSGLAPNTTYHFQFVATNSAGTTSGPDTTFTTAASAPAATAPAIVGQAAPTIGATTATVSASINPNGSATTVVVQYGTTAAYGQQTAAVAIGAGTTLQIVNQNLTGLTPSTVYHFRFVATNGVGTTNGPDSTFTTAVPGGSSQQPPPGAVQNVSANVFPLVGTVLVNGQPLAVGQQIPLGSTIDARNGTVLIRAVINGVVQEMQFAGGIFQLLQLPNGTVQLVLTGGDFSVCKTTKAKKANKAKKKKGVRATRAASRADNAKTVRMLWGNGKGSFQTKGRYAAATVRGTIYQVADRCDGTFTRVRQGTVSVLDLVRNRTVSITAGKSVLIKP
jgi:hypothetical protein